MYKDITYDVILNRMLARVPSDVDKREGSVIYDALAPAAFELYIMYVEFDTILNESFADTASRDYLIKRAKERGLNPSPATYAILKAVSTPSTLELNIGERFSLGNLNYKIISKIDSGQYQVECETAGVTGNQQFGKLIPINYIDGLESIEITQLLIPAEDEEDTEVFRARYLNSFDHKAYGGNIQDYVEKTNAIPGVGSTKVTPVWNGGGTVKLTILDSTYNIANATLIETVQNAIDPIQDGNGAGIAPIGHIVTVDTPTEIVININTNITLQSGYTFEGIKNSLEESIETYLLELREEWANQNTLVVRLSQIERRILDVEGVVDITNTEINNSSSNLVLTAYQVPVLGEITNA